MIAFGVNYRSPSITDESNWASAEKLTKKLDGRVNMVQVKKERIPFPAEDRKATVLTDDFAPVEFLDAMKTNNTT